MKTVCQSARERDPGSACNRDPAGEARLEGSGAVLEAPALVAGLDDVAVVGKAIKLRGGYLGRTVLRFEFGAEDWLLDRLAALEAGDEDREDDDPPEYDEPA